MLATVDANRSKTFCFSINEEGITVTEGKKRYSMSWNNVALAGMGRVSRPKSGSVKYFVFFSAKEDLARTRLSGGCFPINLLHFVMSMLYLTDILIGMRRMPIGA